MSRRHRPVVSCSELQPFYDAIVDAGSDVSMRLILSDWLEEHDQPQEAELLRLHVGLLATCCEPEKHSERVQQQARLVELLAAGVRPCVPRWMVTLVEGVDMTFAWIPPGTFLMGSPASEADRHDDETPHRVTLTRGFRLGIHAVTQGQWQAVMGDNPSHFKGDDRPVEQVSWDDSQAFCTKLGQLVGKRFRLPTEAEWEYACRAGTTTPFFFGETIGTDQANYDGNYTYGRGKKGGYRRKTTAVGRFPSNAWGLFDMHGNVWEWCQDGYGAYPQNDIKDPQSSNNGDARVLRGGSWYDGYPDWCRAACRGWNAPGDRDYILGCRVVLCLD
ncbi:MAG TPA: SUMF1/EgtB/PvdO family nonheme iron enzyme [Gemmataceae bacterium]|nr:SUMF1/EgtB/PvdO family nonheme iron enzyme [Gemmataceae bacterium]